MNSGLADRTRLRTDRWVSYQFQIKYIIVYNGQIRECYIYPKVNQKGFLRWTMDNKEPCYYCQNLVIHDKNGFVFGCCGVGAHSECAEKNDLIRNTRRSKLGRGVRKYATCPVCGDEYKFYDWDYCSTVVLFLAVLEVSTSYSLR